MVAFNFLLTCLLLFGLQGCGVPGWSHVPMVLSGLFAESFLTEQLIVAEVESLGTAEVTSVAARLGFPFGFYSTLLQCSLEEQSQDMSL